MLLMEESGGLQMQLIHVPKYVFLWELQILKIRHTQDKVKFLSQWIQKESL